MHSRIIHNSRLVDATKARTRVVSPVSLYGRGVFTTLAIYNSQPFLYSSHWARLTEHAARAGVDTSEYEEASVRDLLAHLIEANNVKNGLARMTLLATTAEHGVWKIKALESRRTDLLIMTGDPHVVNEEGLALTVSPYRASTLSPLTGIKSVNYLDHILAREEARARDFDEAVALNERGEIVSATVANIFWVINGTVHTPALATGALAGTTRAQIMQLAGELSVPLVEGVYDISDLGDADEIFLTSAGQGVAIVTTFDFHRYTVPVGSVALRLREAFRQLTLKE
ncbi:MAG: branched-chain amino acid aminotransferase [Acidobacteriota bacterium]|jgi:branched-subunit amino acid aminotransferase/4-amino-4-deoxychorismate lyase|nr:branched-chain amino acid aminotransferase [Acidobacteriota bacterium]